MQYREFGKTGEKISVLGFGCMRLPEYEKDGKWYIDDEKAIPMLQKAVELGINYFDTGCSYCHGNSEITVGKALHHLRDKVLFSTKCPMGDDIKGPGDYRRMLEQSLRQMDTDHIDFYHFWATNKAVFDNKILKFNLLDEARKAKEEGLIRHISFSFHDKPEYIKYMIDTAEILETMLVQYNFLDRSCEEMIAYAVQQGLGVVAMGPVGGGRLAAPELYRKIKGHKSSATYELALRFVLGNPNISCALSGMQNLEMLEQNVQIAGSGKTLSDSEWNQIAESVEQMKKFSDLYCTGCNYCQPCPAGINIPHIFNLFTHHNVYGLSQYAGERFQMYLDGGGKTIKDCQGCGLCEEKCPQKLQIRRELARVEKVLDNLSKKD